MHVPMYVLGEETEAQRVWKISSLYPDSPTWLETFLVLSSTVAAEAPVKFSETDTKERFLFA